MTFANALARDSPQALDIHPDEADRLGVQARIRVVMLLLALVTFGCSPVTADRAAAIARDFAVSGQPAGTQVFDLVVGTPEQVDRAWRVQVDFTVLYPLDTSGQRVPIHLLIDVDRNTGEPVIHAQG